MSRRNFLRQIGLATVTMGIAPVTQAVEPLNQKNRTLKIGLLLPENSGYAQLADHYVTGFKTFQLTPALQGTLSLFQTEQYRITNNDFQRKIKSMLFESEVNIIVTHASISLIREVWELFHQNEKILVASVLGEKVGVPLSVSPYVYVNSLNLWQSNWSAGRWVAENIGKKVAIVNSFYDAGYDSGHTFKNGFEEGKGEQIGIFMIDPPNGTFNPQAVIHDVEQFAPDAIFANLSGIAATAFVKAYLNSSLNGKVELIASPLALTEQALPHIGPQSCGIKSIFTWSPVLENKANNDFLSLLSDRKVYNPDVFHLLGYETAQMISEANRSAGIGDFNPHRFSAAMENIKIESPRGMVTMDQQNHISSSPYYLREVSQSNYTLVNQVIAEHFTVTDENNESIRREYSELISGWINPYLTA